MRRKFNMDFSTGINNKKREALKRMMRHAQKHGYGFLKDSFDFLHNRHVSAWVGSKAMFPQLLRNLSEIIG